MENEVLGTDTVTYDISASIENMRILFSTVGNACKQIHEIIENNSESINRIIDVIHELFEKIGEFVLEVMRNYQKAVKIMVTEYRLQDITSYEFSCDRNTMPNAPPIYNFNNQGDVIINNYNDCVITLDNNQHFFTVDRTMNLVSLLFSIIPYCPAIIEVLSKAFL